MLGSSCAVRPVFWMLACWSCLLHQVWSFSSSRFVSGFIMLPGDCNTQSLSTLTWNWSSYRQQCQHLVTATVQLSTDRQTDRQTWCNTQCSVLEGSERLGLWSIQQTAAQLGRWQLCTDDTTGSKLNLYTYIIYINISVIISLQVRQSSQLHRCWHSR